MAQLDTTVSGSFVSGVIIGQTGLAQMTFTANDQLASSGTIGGAPADIKSASQINGTGYVFGARDEGSGSAPGAQPVGTGCGNGRQAVDHGPPTG